jgi:signal transduction histidine kinase
VSQVESTRLDLRMRVRRALRSLLYIGMSVPLGLLAALSLAAAAIGSALSVIWIGAPLRIAAMEACRWLAERERRAVNALLAAHIPPLDVPAPSRRVRPRRPMDVLADRQLVRMLVLLALKLPVALTLVALTAAALVVGGGLLALGVKGILGLGAPTYVGPLRTGVLTGIVLCLLALPVAVLATAGFGGAGSLLRLLSRALLLSPPSAAGAPVREMLAESLGDRTLSIAYWLPDREIFVDEAGQAVTLPQRGSGRAWTAVDRDGRRVAAILHEEELDTSPELVHAAAAAASLALDNERLKADLRARVEELRVSRIRIVEASDAARRQIERDLHDGAQQQLVSLALDLRMLKARLREPAAARDVDRLSEKLNTALSELRELARGIHPAVLTVRGLGPAVEALVHRTSVAVEHRVDVGEHRLSPPIEAAAYFLVAEALTNVVKYAQASLAHVIIYREGDQLIVEVHDDGVGGADIERGSGLRGLTDRISALEGTLRIESPPGVGTHLEARIPCGAAKLVAEAHDAEDPVPADQPPPRAAIEAP